MKISKLSLIFIFWVWIFSVKIQAQNILSITDYGYIPGSRENVIPALKAAIQDASASGSVVIFRKADTIFILLFLLPG